MGHIKRWEELTIQDNFLFQKVMKNERICKKMIEKILHIEIDHISYPEEEKAIDIRLDSKSVRLDVYVKDEKGTIFNIEMQTTNENDVLKKRTRYYQAMIDMDVLEKGNSYDSLNQTYIIFICIFDLFKQNRHIYTFRNICTEDKELELDDMATKIFLNSKGTANDVEKDVQAFLQYVDGVMVENQFVNEINAEVERVRQHDEWRRDYMTLAMELEKQKRDGYNEGKLEGKLEGKIEGKLETASKMLKAKFDYTVIAQITELSIEKISELAKANKLI